jgi:hypothetical protein
MTRTTAPQVTESASKSPLRQLLTESATAKLLSLSPRTLQQWRIRGNGPPFVRLGAAIRYDAEMVADWVNERLRTNTSGTDAA